MWLPHHLHQIKHNIHTHQNTTSHLHKQHRNTTSQNTHKTLQGHHHSQHIHSTKKHHDTIDTTDTDITHCMQYITPRDIPRPTEPVKRICYADDKTVSASRVKLPELEHKINDYLTRMSRFLRDNSLLISAPKSTVPLFTPDPKQANTHPKFKISDAELSLVSQSKAAGSVSRYILLI